MNYFIVPITSQIVAGRTVNAPKYLSTDMLGLPFACIPYGVEGVGIVSLASPNAALAAESDVYAFPADLTRSMSASDVATLSAFLAALNVPTSQLVSGMTFNAALQTIAKIFLVAQAMFGRTGNKIFTGGTSLSTPVGNWPIVAVVPSSNGPFDFSSVAATDTVGDTLDAISQQFTAAVNLGTF